jgi:hypothetical protein
MNKIIENMEEKFGTKISDRDTGAKESGYRLGKKELKAQAKMEKKE